MRFAHANTNIATSKRQRKFRQKSSQTVLKSAPFVPSPALQIDTLFFTVYDDRSFAVRKSSTNSTPTA
jgi:hypothetical protein